MYKHKDIMMTNLKKGSRDEKRKTNGYIGNV